MVATAELRVSLSCLGAAGTLFQLNAPTATASSQPPGMPSTAAEAQPCCTPGVTQTNRLPAHCPEPANTVDEQAGETERQYAAAGKRGSCAFTGEQVDSTPPFRGSGGSRCHLGRREPGDTSWICEFNPHDGSLTEVVATPKAHEVAGTAVLGAARENPDHTQGKLASNDGGDPGIAAGSAEGASWKREEQFTRSASSEDSKNPATATDENVDGSSSPGSSVPASTAAESAESVASAASAVPIGTTDLKLTTTAPLTPVAAVVNSGPDQVPPLLVSEEVEEGEVAGAGTRIVETGEGALGKDGTTDGIDIEEPQRVTTVVLGRKTAGGVLPGACIRALRARCVCGRTGRGEATRERK